MASKGDSKVVWQFDSVCDFSEIVRSKIPLSELRKEVETVDDVVEKVGDG
tara:strand:+ start:1240 stop:1389 length:150 start_codon:yes stop_codon:yes gene_type:complete